MTAHNKAKKGEIAKVVLMPGDPLRAKWIAETFLENPVLVNDIRGMYAYTGKYNNKTISVMGHGMGIPSIGIYSWELYNFYDVDLIIRVGSAGSYDKDINVGDIMLVKESYSESVYAKEIGVNPVNNVLLPTKKAYDFALNIAKNSNIKVREITVHSSDNFYGSIRSLEQIIKDTKAQAVEMESFALFANAMVAKKQGITLLTCSDSLVTHQVMPAEDRQNKFVDMMKLALEIASKYE